MSGQKTTSRKTITSKTVTQKKRAAGPTAKVPVKKAAPKGLVSKIAAEETDVLKMFIRTYALF